MGSENVYYEEVHKRILNFVEKLEDEEFSFYKYFRMSRFMLFYG